MPDNVCIVKEILSYPVQHPEFYFKTFYSIVYSDSGKNPDLIVPNPQYLDMPFSDLISKVNRACIDHDHGQSVKLVFDERMGTQRNLGIAIKRFIGGTGVSNVHSTPYFASSNSCPGVQIADIMAAIVSKRAQKEAKIMSLYKILAKTQWEDSLDGLFKYGYRRYDQKEIGNSYRYTGRRNW